MKSVKRRCLLILPTYSHLWSFQGSEFCIIILYSLSSLFHVFAPSIWQNERLIFFSADSNSFQNIIVGTFPNYILKLWVKLDMCNVCKTFILNVVFLRENWNFKARIDTNVCNSWTEKFPMRILNQCCFAVIGHAILNRIRFPYLCASPIFWHYLNSYHVFEKKNLSRKTDTILGLFSLFQEIAFEGENDQK